MYLRAAVPMDYYKPSRVPAGYFRSSAFDMTRFLYELNGGVIYGHRVLSAAGIAQSQVGAVSADSDIRYRAGWLVGPVAGVSAIYHYATTNIFEAFAALDPQTRRGAVVLINGQGLLAVSAVRNLEAGVTRLLADATREQCKC